MREPQDGGVTSGVRIRKQVPAVDVIIKCSKCSSNIAPARGMTVEQMAAYTSQKYGEALCAGCAGKAAADLNNVKEQANENDTN